jgi:hypothetical protein
MSRRSWEANDEWDRRGATMSPVGHAAVATGMPSRIPAGAAADGDEIALGTGGVVIAAAVADLAP